MTVHLTCPPPPRPLLRLGAIALLALVSGCDALDAEPGGDFAVRVRDPALSAVGEISVPLAVDIAGCGAFEAAIHGSSGVHPVALERQPDGSFVAAVPVDWLRGEGGCTRDALEPHETRAQLAVTCLDAGRTATADLTISYATATRARVLRNALAYASLQVLFRSADPFRPYALAPSYPQRAADLDPLPSGWPFWIDGAIQANDPLVRPRLAAGGAAVFLTSGCDPAATCPGVAGPGGASLPGVLLSGQGIDAAGGPTLARWPNVWVPANVVDLAFDEHGDLVALSQLQVGPAPGDVAIAVTRVALDASGTAAVEVIGYFPGERARTVFSRSPDGQLAFVSFRVPPSPGPLVSVLHATDGTSVSSLEGVTGTLDVGVVWPTGTLAVPPAYLSPDGGQLVVGGAWAGSPGGAFVPLPVSEPFSADGPRGGVVWPTGAVALWRAGSSDTGSPGAVEVFDASPPHARRYRYEVRPLPGSSGPASLLGAAAVGDRLVLTTGTGVRVLDPDGALVGGADPFPCRLAPSAVAIQSGPAHAAVGAGDDIVYVFDVSGP